MEILKHYEFGGLAYKVSNYGRVFGVKGELKQRKNEDDYLQVTMGSCLNRTGKLVHRLVAEAFIENSSNLEEVNHKDFDRANNYCGNLEWISHGDNVRYSSQRGNYNGVLAGIKNGRAKYSKEDIIKIRKLYDNGYCIMDIIKELFPGLEYKQRKNKWTRVKDICIRKTYIDI